MKHSHLRAETRESPAAAFSAVIILLLHLKYL